MCFRDVFEVDGKPVRDREDRLQKLFLAPSPDAYAQLVRIKEESARYNIGSVDRNINLPLFALQFLRAEHRTRSRFKISGAAGVGRRPDVADRVHRNGEADDHHGPAGR